VTHKEEDRGVRDGLFVGFGVALIAWLFHAESQAMTAIRSMEPDSIAPNEIVESAHLQSLIASTVLAVASVVCIRLTAGTVVLWLAWFTVLCCNLSYHGYLQPLTQAVASIAYSADAARASWFAAFGWLLGVLSIARRRLAHRAKVNEPAPAPRDA
jgi:hypothetical protein